MSESEYDGNESSAMSNKAIFMGNNNFKHTQLNLIPNFLKSENRFFNDVNKMNDNFSNIPRKQ